MQKIWKAVIPMQDKITLELPEHAWVMSVAVQHGQPCIWFLCNPDAPKKERHFRLFGTGQPIEDSEAPDRAFIGTFQLYGGDFVGHLFEVS